MANVIDYVENNGHPYWKQSPVFLHLSVETAWCAGGWHFCYYSIGLLSQTSSIDLTLLNVFLQYHVHILNWHLRKGQEQYKWTIKERCTFDGSIQPAGLSDWIGTLTQATKEENHITSNDCQSKSDWIHIERPYTLLYMYSIYSKKTPPPPKKQRNKQHKHLIC